MKILVLRVIKSSRHRKYFARGYMHSFFVSKAPTRSYLARSGFFTQKTRAYNLVRRTFYDVNYRNGINTKSNGVSVVRNDLRYQ